MAGDYFENLIDMSWDQPVGNAAPPVINPDVEQIEVSRAHIESQARGVDHVDHLVWHEGRRVRIEFNITDGQVDGINTVRALVDRRKWTVETWTPGVVDLI